MGTVGTVHGYGTHRTHHCTQVATDLATNSLYIFWNLLFIIKNFNTKHFCLKKSVARSVANWVHMVGMVGTVHGYGTQYHTYVPMCRTYVPMSRTMRTLFTVPVVLSKPYLKEVAIRALLLNFDNIYYGKKCHVWNHQQVILCFVGFPSSFAQNTPALSLCIPTYDWPSNLGGECHVPLASFGRIMSNSNKNLKASK